MDTTPGPIARIAAPILVGALAGVVVSTLMGKKAGIIGALLAVGAHEVFDAPVGRELGQYGL